MTVCKESDGRGQSCEHRELHRLRRAIAHRRRIYHANGHISFQWQPDQRYPRRMLLVIAEA